MNIRNILSSGTAHVYGVSIQGSRKKVWTGVRLIVCGAVLPLRLFPFSVLGLGVESSLAPFLPTSMWLDDLRHTVPEWPQASIVPSDQIPKAISTWLCFAIVGCCFHAHFRRCPAGDANPRVRPLRHGTLLRARARTRLLERSPFSDTILSMFLERWPSSKQADGPSLASFVFVLLGSIELRL